MNPKIRNVGVGERLIAVVAVMQAQPECKYVKKSQIVSSHKTQLMAKLSLFLSYNDMFRPTTTAIVRLYMKPF